MNKDQKIKNLHDNCQFLISVCRYQCNVLMSIATGEADPEDLAMEAMEVSTARISALIEKMQNDSK